MKKSPIFIANWKMYKSAQEAQHYTTKLMPNVSEHLENVYIAAPFTAIRACYKVSRHTPLHIGAQNVAKYFEGAYTGEISASMIKDAGADFCLVGHSERRHVFNETNADVREKIVCLLSNKILPVLCVGETLEEREENRTEEVIKTQVLESLEGLSELQVKSILIAYEPVWAIGTGKVATPDIANEAHQMCKKALEIHWPAAAQEVPILYGGSVKPENTRVLLQEHHVDGVLVGGASLEPESFSKIILEGTKE